MTLAQTEALVTNRTPVQAIVLEIRKRSIGFEATDAALINLKKLGAGETVIQELKKTQVRQLSEKPAVATASDDGVIRILVANFGTPKEQSDAITETILEQLRQATRDYPYVEIKALNETINALDGEAVAKVKGKEKGADIVLWGWYKTTSQKVLINAHFEVISNIPRLPLNENSQMFVAPLPEFEGFNVQLQLSKEMTYLTLLAIGLIRYEADDFDAAAEYFSRALAQQTPVDKMINPATVYIFRASARYQNFNLTGLLNDADKIIDDLNAAIKLSPTDSTPYVLMVSTLIIKKEQAAFQFTDKLNALAQKEPDLFQKAYNYFIIANAHLYLNDDAAEAKKYFFKATEILAAPPDSFEKFFLLSFSYLGSGDILRAVVSLDKAQNLIGDNNRLLPKLLLIKGGIYALAENYEIALENFDKIIKINPNYLPARIARVEVFKEMENFEAALRELDEAVALYPDEAGLYSSRAEFYEGRKEYDKAGADYQKAITLEPENAENYYNLGFIYRRGKRIDDAITAFTNYFKIKSDNSYVYGVRGDLYREKNADEKFVADYKTALALRIKQNDNEEANAMKAMFFTLFSHFILAGDFKSGVEQADLYIVFRPKDPEGYKQKAYFLATAKEYDRAVEELNRALILDANDADAYRRRAEAWKNKNDFEKALTDINRAVAIKPKDFELYLERAELYEKKGDPSKALKDFDQAFEIAVRLDQKERVRLAKQAFELNQKIKRQEN